MNMKPVTTYLKYLWRSTNEHGVHSPFVYDLVTKALRFKGQSLPHPAVRSLPFFPALSSKYQRALNNALHHLYGEHTPAVVCGVDGNTGNADLVYFEPGTDKQEIAIKDLLSGMADHSLLMMVKHGNCTIWEALTRHPEVHLTIDCHRIGLAWKRPQQAKENFIIRL